MTTQVAILHNVVWLLMSNRGLILHIAICTVVLGMVLRTWLVMGLIEPVKVSGSSMAPTLRGPHLSLTCKKCGDRIDVGAEFQVAPLECPSCGCGSTSAEDLPVLDGDNLMVDRVALQFRHPRRWEPVVFRSPEDGQLAVKRIVGLPGESLQLRNGDVWIGGKIARKSLEEMRGVRQLIHEETARGHRWHGDAHDAWQWHNGAWQVSTKDGNWHWLRYQHLNNEPITSDSVYNAGLTRRLFPVRDLALSAKVRAAGSGRLSIRFDNGSDHFSWQSSLPDEAFLEVFAFDHHWQVFLDDVLIAENDRIEKNVNAGTASPFAIGVHDLELVLADLRIYRDVYHASRNEELGIKPPMAARSLKRDEVFVIGDNVPVSIDSRHWGPVPLRLIVGKPLGVR